MDVTLLKRILYLLAVIAIFLLCGLLLYVLMLLDQPSAQLYNAVELDRAMTQIDSRFDQLESQLLPEREAFTEMVCEYGLFDSITNRIPLTLILRPNATYAHFQEAILHCNGANISLSRSGDSFTATYDANIFETQSISGVTFLDEEIMQTVFLSWTIDPSRQVIPKLISTSIITLDGTKRTKPRYTGTLHVAVLDFPEKSGKIVEVNLIKRFDGKDKTSTPIKYQFQNHFLESFTINTKIDASIPDGSTLDLIIELVDAYGLRYHCLLKQLGPDKDIFAHPPREIRVLDRDGTLLYEISS